MEVLSEIDADANGYGYASFYPTPAVLSLRARGVIEMVPADVMREIHGRPCPNPERQVIAGKDVELWAMRRTEVKA